MSHEPLKFAPKAEAPKVGTEEAPVRDLRAVDPKSVRARKTEGTGVEIDWKDGHQSVYTFQWLRDACPCALCQDEREKTGQKPGAVPKSKPGTLPMYREPVRPLEIAPVGKYAISFQWNDGHQHGIYSWEYLREWCPCAQCSLLRT